MAYRYTNTGKWDDAWFSDLKTLEKLLFVYLCDNCDCAGFIEVIPRHWANDIGEGLENVKQALVGIEKAVIYSESRDCIFLKTFLKHQKNLPLNISNKSHQGIIYRYNLYKHKFKNQYIIDIFEGASKGLFSPTGKGNSKGNGNCNLERGQGETKTWRTDFQVYQNDLRSAWKDIVTPEYIAERQKFHPNLEIKLTLQKACKDYWLLEKGWNNKRSKPEEIDWKYTFNISLLDKLNQVYKNKFNGENQAGYKYPSIRPKQKVFEIN